MNLIAGMWSMIKSIYPDAERESDDQQQSREAIASDGYQTACPADTTFGGFYYPLIITEANGTYFRSKSAAPSSDSEYDYGEMDSFEMHKTSESVECEKQMHELLDDKEEVDLEAHRYGRRFMKLCEEIVRQTGYPKCPLSEGELQDFRLNRATMPDPKRSKIANRTDFSRGCDAFALPWMVPKSKSPKPQYGDSVNDAHHAEGDVTEKECRTESASKPDHKPTSSMDPSDAESKELLENVHSVLKKITPSNFAELGRDFLKLKVYANKDNMSAVIDAIFDKAVQESISSQILSDLCKQQVMAEMETTDGESTFRTGVQSKCREMFDVDRINAFEVLRKEAEAEDDVKKRAQLMAESEKAERLERQRKFGSIELIGHLYRNELLAPDTLRWCIDRLFQRCEDTPDGDEESIECVVVLLERVGEMFDHDSTKDGNVEEKTAFYYQNLQDLSKQVSSRVRIRIKNLIDLRKNGWDPVKLARQKAYEERPVGVRKELSNDIQFNQYEQLAAIYAENQDELDSAYKQIAKLEAENEELSAKIATLENEKSGATTKGAQDEEASKLVFEQVETLKLEVVDLKEQLSNATRRNEEQERNILSLEEKIKALEQPVTQANETVSNLQTFSERRTAQEQSPFTTFDDIPNLFSGFRSATTAVDGFQLSRAETNRLKLFSAVRKRVPEVDMNTLMDTLNKLRIREWHGKLPKDMKVVVTAVSNALMSDALMHRFQSPSTAWNENESSRSLRDIQALLNNGQYECKICLSPCLPRQSLLCCPNSACNEPFHRNCVNEWLINKSDCPNCRQLWVTHEDFPPLPLFR